MTLARYQRAYARRSPQTFRDRFKQHHGTPRLPFNAEKAAALRAIYTAERPAPMPKKQKAYYVQTGIGQGGIKIFRKLMAYVKRDRVRAARKT